MTLARLNTVGPHSTEAAGIIPPMMRAMVHIGYAIAVADSVSDEEWLASGRPRAVDEGAEAFSHLNGAHSIDMTPFISGEAIRHIGTIKEQLSTLPELLSAGTRADAFEALGILADNMAHISAVAENYLTGGSADEGRNP